MITYLLLFCYFSIKKVNTIPFHYIASEKKYYVHFVFSNATMRRFKMSAFILVLHYTNFLNLINIFREIMLFFVLPQKQNFLIFTITYFECFTALIFAR